MLQTLNERVSLVHRYTLSDWLGLSALFAGVTGSDPFMSATALSDGEADGDRAGCGCSAS